ncbi:hypothetical protein DFA_11120 [Cavenderia fasciculata]|uniref:Prolyl 4-hydroxylase alpha subunit Fe(2+) 2OG dioxygenase domain-containing protein n=1 Tax=Cavenderia fasciculata TaxID=261658 RepID=F4QF00_CACFS|nr:uncharacterized protein DFA_11120 [Cavenderia fasciculata]EGG13359.1 hypothetical protein DFA_11120 [Cavenderia fasciculata]|eukprot:XP_004350063.1 hypothetical protein DFA_11120 [Cavenderia fasciculata]
MTIEIEYNEELEGLETTINQIKGSGEGGADSKVYCEGDSKRASPKVNVKDVGELKFPITQESVQKLIDKSTRAPFGKGEQTITDLSVRKVWQIDASEVTVTGGKAWQTFIETTLPEQIIKGLGLPKDTDLTIELYKMLVYDKGAFFSSHRDTEKADGMFATMVVSLPSHHRGGELVIEHDKESYTVSLVNDTKSMVKYVAFYADCKHKVEPVTEGYRVNLVYNLIRSKGTCTTSSQSNAELLLSSIRSTFGEGERSRLIYSLEHVYSPASFCLEKLKGKDAVVASALIEASKLPCSQLAVGLGFIHIEEEGGFTGYTNDESTTVDFSDNECEPQEYTFNLVSPKEIVDGYEINTSKTIEHSELFPANAFDEAKPYEQEATEAAGNEGATYFRRYQRSCLIIHSLEHLDGGLYSLVPFAMAERILKERLGKSLDGTENDEDREKDMIREITQYTSVYGSGDIIASILKFIEVSQLLSPMMPSSSRELVKKMIKILFKSQQPAAKKPSVTTLHVTPMPIIATYPADILACLPNSLFNIYDYTKFDHLLQVIKQLCGRVPVEEMPDVGSDPTVDHPLKKKCLKALGILLKGYGSLCNCGGDNHACKHYDLLSKALTTIEEMVTNYSNIFGDGQKIHEQLLELLTNPTEPKDITTQLIEILYEFHSKDMTKKKREQMFSSVFLLYLTRPFKECDSFITPIISFDHYVRQYQYYPVAMQKYYNAIVREKGETLPAATLKTYTVAYHRKVTAFFSFVMLNTSKPFSLTISGARNTQLDYRPGQDQQTLVEQVAVEMVTFCIKAGLDSVMYEVLKESTLDARLIDMTLYPNAYVVILKQIKNLLSEKSKTKQPPSSENSLKFVEFVKSKINQLTTTLKNTQTSGSKFTFACVNCYCKLCQPLEDFLRSNEINYSITDIKPTVEHCQEYLAAFTLGQGTNQLVKSSKTPPALQKHIGLLESTIKSYQSLLE